MWRRSLRSHIKGSSRGSQAPTPTSTIASKHGQLQMWGELLIANMSDLPLEMQHEVRFNLDSYIMGLRRQVRPYNVASTPKKGQGKSNKNKLPPSAACGSEQQQLHQQQQVQAQQQQQQQQQGSSIINSLSMLQIPSLQGIPTCNTNLHQLQNALVVGLP